MIYIDTSSLLKLVLPDLQSEATRTAVLAENSVAVSALADLEARVQIRALFLGGKLSEARTQRLRDRLMEIIGCAPFSRKKLQGSLFETAITQHEASLVHCRSLDRMHLAAMAELEIKRLMTHDQRQAQVAIAAGYQVITPGDG